VSSQGTKPNPAVRPDPSRAIFINYRREDSGGQARALLYALERAFPNQVFMDVKGLAPGVNYLEEIEHTVGNCKVVLVLIGKGWAGVVDAAGKRRLKDPRDVVALEIGTALLRHDVLVIPVLVGGAALPNEDDLPEPLHGLLSRQCLQLTEQDWDYNVSQLVETLRRKVGQSGAGSRSRLRLGLAAAGMLALVGGGGAFLALRSGSPSSPPAAPAPAPSPVPGASAPVPSAAPAAPPSRSTAPPAPASTSTEPTPSFPTPSPVKPPPEKPAPEKPVPAAKPAPKVPGPPPSGTAQPPAKAPAPAKSPAPAKAPSPAKAPVARPPSGAAVAATAEPVRTDPAPPKSAEQRLAFATSEVLAFNQYLGSPEARGHGRTLVGSAKWYLGPRDAFTFAPADQAPGFFPMTVRATRDGDRVSFEGMRSGRASDGQAYVRISGHLVLGKSPILLTVDLEFGRVSSTDGTELQPTFKSQARLQLRPE
jgi:hypothetical protein